MKLYSGPLSMFGAKAQIALLEKGLHSSWRWCRSTWGACTSRNTPRSCE